MQRRLVISQTYFKPLLNGWHFSFAFVTQKQWTYIISESYCIDVLNSKNYKTFSSYVTAIVVLDDDVDDLNSSGIKKSSVI